MGINDKMVSKPFDPKKPFRFKGHPVFECQFVGYTPDGNLAIAYRRKKSDGRPWTTTVNKPDGSCVYETMSDGYALVNIPEKVVRYVNVPIPGKNSEYEDSMGRFLAYSRPFDHDAFFREFSTVKLTFEDGKLIESEVIR